MAERWFYSADGTEQGPVSGKELVALARGGKLRPTDLVWKEGMADWKPAGKVKGLFPASAATPPPLPTLAPAAAPPAPMPLSGRRKKGLLIVGSVLTLCVVVAAAAVVALLGNGRNPDSNSVPKRPGEFVELRDFADVPPPVKDAADAGHEVWELTGWHRQHGSSFELNASLYVVLEHGTLAHLFVKEHHKKGSVVVGNKGKKREIIQWAEEALDVLPTEKSKLEWHWTLKADATDRFTLLFKTVVEVPTEDTATETAYIIVIDDKVKEGYWQGEEITHIKYRGRMAKFPDEDRRKTIEGGAVRLLGQRSLRHAAIQPPKAAPSPTPGNPIAVAPPVSPAPGVPKDAGPQAPPRPPMPEPKAAAPAVPEPKAVVPAKPKLIPVYKVVFPSDVLLTTNEQEVKNIVEVYPGEFKGGKGHYQEVFGYAFAGRQEGTVLLRRYCVGTMRVFTTRKLDNPNYKEEGMGAWVYEKEQPGTTPRLGFFRKKDAAREYGPEKTIQFFRNRGYSPSELRFYLFDRPELP